MGTKLEYSINLLASSPSSATFSVHCVDDCHLDYLQTRGLTNISFQITGLNSNSMIHKMTEKHNIDLIRKTMQTHDDTFKHQVRELHRLYSAQKMLMEELKTEMEQNNKYWSPITTVHNSYHYSFNLPSPREKSGSCSGESMRITTTRGFYLERPAEEDVSNVVSATDDARTGTTSSSIPLNGNSNKISNDGSHEDSEVELTLSIGGGSTSKKISGNQELAIHNRQAKELDSPAAFFKSERGEDCSAPTTPMSSSSATFDHVRKQPHWLFQGLSINRTS